MSAGRGESADLAHPILVPVVSSRRRDRAKLLCATARPFYSASADSVLQAAMLPCLSPAMNQRLRCSEVPWVKASGTT
jgi:hypothetical protein